MFAGIAATNLENETVPTVTVAGHAMVNPSKRQVTDAVRSRAPHLLRAARNASSHG